jgi:hypothetical protein
MGYRPEFDFVGQAEGPRPSTGEGIEGTPGTAGATQGHEGGAGAPCPGAAESGGRPSDPRADAPACQGQAGVLGAQPAYTSFRQEIAACLTNLFGDVPREHEIAMFAGIVDREVQRMLALEISKGVTQVLEARLAALTPTERKLLHNAKVNQANRAGRGVR